MKGPLYISDDGTTQGTEQEVAAYEHSMDPLAKLNLPWAVSGSTAVRDSKGNSHGLVVDSWLVELVNEGLPLIEDLRCYISQNWGHDWRERDHNGSDSPIRSILLAYEKALGIQP